MMITHVPLIAGASNDTSAITMGHSHDLWADKNEEVQIQNSSNMARCVRSGTYLRDDTHSDQKQSLEILL